MSAIKSQHEVGESLIEVVRRAGSGGIGLTEALRQAGGRQPTGRDYVVASRLNVANNGPLCTYVAAGKRTWLVHSDHKKSFVDGGGPTRVLRSPPAAEPQPTQQRRRRRRHKRDDHQSSCVLVTLQYGEHESVTLTIDDARQVFKRLAILFGGAQ